jgi:hypothetical protein
MRPNVVFVSLSFRQALIVLTVFLRRGGWESARDCLGEEDVAERAYDLSPLWTYEFVDAGFFLWWHALSAQMAGRGARRDSFGGTGEC